MSEATLEQPEVKETPVSAPPTPASAITFELFGGKKDKTAADQLAKEPEVKVETPTEEKKVDAPVTESGKKKNDAETNLANMRKKLEEYEAQVKAAQDERDRLKGEYEAFKTKPPELPEEIKTKLTAAEEREKELMEARALIRQTNLARDPDFRAKYEQPIQNKIKSMGQIALASGIPDNEWRAAVTSWNRDKFGEWIDAMNPGDRIAFQAAWQKTEELYTEQNDQLQNAEKVWTEMEKQRKDAFEAQQKDVLAGNEKLARQIIKDTLARGDAASYEGITEALEGAVLKAARYELSAEEVFQQIAANQVLARSVQKQDATLKERESKIAELEKKLAEQDEFIKAHAGAVPRETPAGKTSESGDKYVPPWQRIVVK